MKRYRLENLGPLLALVAVAALAPGCILAKDFSAKESQQTDRDAGADADQPDADQPDADQLDADQLDATADADQPDTAADTGPDAAADTGQDTGPSYTSAPITTNDHDCPNGAPVYRVAADTFGAAKDFVFQTGTTTQFDLGPPAANRFSASEQKVTHSIGIAAATYDNKLAVGWATVRDDDLSASSAPSVDDATTILAGGELTEPLTDNLQPGDALEVYSVEMFPTNPLDGAQYYNIAVLTNAGVYTCVVRGQPNQSLEAELQAPVSGQAAAFCEYDDALNGLLTGKQLYPARRVRWMPHTDSPLKLVFMIEGGRDHLKLGFFDVDLFPYQVSYVAPDSGVEQTRPAGGFFASLLAYGWSDAAGNYPQAYLLDATDEGPRAVELTYADSDTASYAISSNPRDYPLSPDLDLSEDHFAFVYRLFGKRGPFSPDPDSTAGYVGLTQDGQQLIFAGAEQIDHNDWLTADATDAAAVHAFPTGGPALVALTRGGQNPGHLELGNWNFDSTYERVPGVVTIGTHDIGGIGQVTLDANWELHGGKPNFSDALPELPGVLGFAASSHASGGTDYGLYLVHIPDTRQVGGLCQ